MFAWQTHLKKRLRDGSNERMNKRLKEEYQRMNEFLVLFRSPVVLWNVERRDGSTRQIKWWTNKRHTKITHTLPAHPPRPYHPYRPTRSRFRYPSEPQPTRKEKVSDRERQGDVKRQLITSELSPLQRMAGRRAAWRAVVQKIEFLGNKSDQAIENTIDWAFSVMVMIWFPSLSTVMGGKYCLAISGTKHLRSQLPATVYSAS